MFGFSDGQVGARRPRAASGVPRDSALNGSVWIISPACLTEEGGPITMDDGNQLYVNFKNRVSIANGRDGEFSTVPDESRTWIVNQGVIRLLDGRQIFHLPNGFLGAEFEGCRQNNCDIFRLWYQRRKRCALAKATARTLARAEAMTQMLQQV